MVAPSAAPLLVFSHLNWDFVWQRPQHLLSRLAQTRRVYVIEEPVFDPHADAHWERRTPQPNLVVLKPHTPCPEGGFNDAQAPHLRPLVEALVRDEGLDAFVAWLYTPMALPLLDGLQPDLVVYDCMDELSAFDFAPPQLLALEAALLDQADLVFTGGPSLYGAKKDRHPSVHLFTSSVEADHFRQALADGPEPDVQAHLPRPRLGYYGVIDERMDLAVIDALARSHPDWQIVMVGPVVKIDPGALPRHPNLHYPGQQSYTALPDFLRGWDVALMPFARNRATRFISPTKVLEYMAAERPIVSTPIHDVAEPYGDIVYLGDTPEAFVAACEQALGASADEQTARTDRMREVLARTSWDRTARHMDDLLTQALAARAAV